MKNPISKSHQEDYIKFLERRLKSKHFKANVSPEEYKRTETKLKNARLVLKVVK